MLHDPEGNHSSGVRDWKNLKSWVDFKIQISEICTIFFLHCCEIKNSNFDEIALFKFCSLILQLNYQVNKPLVFFRLMDWFSVCVLGAKGLLRGASEVMVKRGGTKKEGEET